MFYTSRLTGRVSSHVRNFCESMQGTWCFELREVFGGRDILLSRWLQSLSERNAWVPRAALVDGLDTRREGWAL
jgi:hypothetical protein